MEAILASPQNQVQEFLAAGHVCAVMGYTEYEPIAQKFQVPIVDLAMAGARPLYLKASFILEEGLAMETFWKVVQSMQAAAQAANVAIATGDTKVVGRGKGDGLFINTAGIGVIEHAQSIAPQSVQPSDAILLNGDIGRHGIAIMAVREGLDFESNIESDCAPLSDAVQALLAAGIEIHRGQGRVGCRGRSPVQLAASLNARRDL
jgi:hydrogenase expression/formation protein HypE